MHSRRCRCKAGRSERWQGRGPSSARTCSGRKRFGHQVPAFGRRASQCRRSPRPHRLPRADMPLAPSRARSRRPFRHRGNGVRRATCPESNGLCGAGASKPVMVEMPDPSAANWWRARFRPAARLSTPAARQSSGPRLRRGGQVERRISAGRARRRRERRQGPAQRYVRAGNVARDGRKGRISARG